VEATIDFPVEVIEVKAEKALSSRSDDLARECQELAGTFRIGKAILQGIEVAIRGPVNAGKSSLLNALCGQERMLVSAEPGTTRDYVEVQCEWGGVPITLIDTAGPREGASDLERRGIELGQSRAAEADLEIVLHPAPIVESGSVVGAGISRELHVISKSDLLSSCAPPAWLKTSSISGVGLRELREAVVERCAGVLAQNDVDRCITSERQRKLLDESAAALRRASILERGGSSGELVALELRGAAERLGELLGETVVEGMLDRLFSRFCIGK
jgi:tRNA modification GTPase